MFKVQDVMLKSIPKIHPKTELTQAIALLKQYQLIGAPVIDQQGQLVGYISEQDCLAPLTQDSYFCDGTTHVKTVMQPPSAVTTPHTSVLDLASKMQNSTLPKQYPVVSDNQLVGLVTRTQVLQALSQSYLACNKLE